MRLSLALLLSGSLLIAGCGGGDESSATTEKEWAGEVTDVCRKSEDAARKAAAKGQQKGLGQQELIAYVLDESIPIQKNLVEDLDAIEAPEDIQDDYDQFVSRLREGLPLFEQLADAVRENKRDPELEAKFKQLGQDTRPFAEEHGLKACLADQS
jgi:hypothetical protein